MTKYGCLGLEVHEVFAVAGVDTLFSVVATMDSRLPDFQELDLWPRRACQDTTGTLEVDVLYSILELLILPWIKRQQLNKHCHQHCYWELEDPSFCPDPQCKLTTLHPKWTTSRASWLLNVHLDPPMTFLLLLHQPTDLVLGFLSMVIPTILLLKKTPFQWTTVTQEAFSHHDVAFTSTPVLLCPDSAQPFIVQSRVFKPNNWSYFITRKAKFIP